jgi:GH35 family endo-1,4-beta-xylanase
VSCGEEKFSYDDGRTPLEDIREIPLADDEQLSLYDSLLAYIPAGFKLGCGVDMVDGYMNQAEHKRLVDQNFNAVTVGYHMKHGAMVGSTGALSFTAVDRFVRALPDGMDIFGHTLAWHQNQNAVYLNDQIAATVVPSDDVATGNLLANGGFENELAGWAPQHGRDEFFSITTESTEIISGSKALKVAVPAESDNSDYISLRSDTFNVLAGHYYEISCYVRSNTQGAFGLAISSGNLGNQYPYVQGHLGGSDGQYATSLVWKFCPHNADVIYGTNVMLAVADAPMTFSFRLGNVPSVTYYIDHVKVLDLGATDSVAALTQSTTEKSREQKAEIIDGALNDWITKMVGHYAQTGIAGRRTLDWDAVNEPMTEMGTLRTAPADPASDEFYWMDYLGQDYAVKTIQYARAAAPTRNLVLFVNDYNLETNNAKLEGLINFVKYIDSKGQTVDGIGTQTHASIRDTSGIAALKAGVDNMFTKLAATGKLIKISELDIQVGSTTPSADLLKRQSDIYRYIIDSYMKHIPQAQQYGVTLWGLGDGQNGSGWLPDDAPCIWDNKYNRKPAYKGTADGLAGREVGADWTYGDLN